MRRRASSLPSVLASVHSLRSRRRSCSERGGADALLASLPAERRLDPIQPSLPCRITISSCKLGAACPGRPFR
jgi:hypothetical protein